RTAAACVSWRSQRRLLELGTGTRLGPLADQCPAEEESLQLLAWSVAEALKWQTLCRFADWMACQPHRQQQQEHRPPPSLPAWSLPRFRQHPSSFSMLLEEDPDSSSYASEISRGADSCSSIQSAYCHSFRHSGGVSGTVFRLRNSSQQSSGNRFNQIMPFFTSMNLSKPNIGKAGSLHEFLCNLHAEHGPLAGFYFGQQFVVSLASSELMRQTVRLFDKPPELFKLFEPLIGPKSIQYANGLDGRTRRNTFDRAFSHEAVGRTFPVLDECADELIEKLRAMAAKGERIPLSRFCIGLAIKAILRVTVEPDSASLPDEQVAQLKSCYDLAWNEMETRLTQGEPEAGDHRVQAFNDALSHLHEFVDSTVRRRSAIKFDSDVDKTFGDLAIELHAKDAEALRSDVITYMVGGFHTSGYLLLWALYYAIQHPNLADRLRAESAEVLGATGEANMAAIGQMTFHRAFLDETMRLSCLAPFAARVSDAEVEVGGHTLPAGTPVIQALGAAGMCSEAYPEPDDFNPDRWTGQQLFEPFGFGRRKCPGYRLAYAETALWLSRLLAAFRFRLVDETYTAVSSFGLLTKPKEEVWVLAEALID
uniref:Cytochrome P450 n=1 Tax=Macrostomum lignano TaxID=282301 RepID=A0A1I8FSC8_9PLAT